MLFLGIGTPLLGQKVLSLENPNKFKRHIFEPGDYIRFHTHDSQARFSGVIEALNDTIIVLVKQVYDSDQRDATPRTFRDYVPISEIKVLYLTKPSFWGKLKETYYRSTMVGGSIVIGGTVINTLTGGGPPDPIFMILSTSILTSGFLVKYLGRDKYKIGKKWTLRVMEPMVIPELEARKGGS